ncbi:TFIIH/NER complex subunit [Coemansia sp. RSA 2706]|nr:TFIIH/NER complex subunit [Coemansia sp. RSA 2711]KAJ2292850.1 TFIIH/NER complex subunit [Coemansia sp. RSA 2706]KAJ2307005.1 TFIIH/NER complex subunit [Coemansia sp. RSA 2704]KAJ2358208.1 TFIIH/NER complex subunit [Coemansia sp. RSA 2610]
MEMFAPAKSQNLPDWRTEFDICPQCNTDRYLEKQMRLLVSPCYHRMCDKCVHNRFSTGPAPCPECPRILRKNDFYQPVFEDLTVENEVRIRQELALIFNKREDDFKSAKDYNAYLEMVEDLILKRLNDVEADETDDQIRQYKRENLASIAKNKTKQQREARLYQAVSQQERAKRQQQRAEYQKELEEERRAKAQIKSSLIDELATSDKDAKEIVKRQMIQLKKSSLSNRGSTRKMQVDIEALLGTIDEEFGADMDDEDEELADGGPFDPAESPYEPMRVELRDKYEDANPAFRQGTLAAAGISREMHQRYMIEGAMAGLFVAPLEDKDS